MNNTRIEPLLSESGHSSLSSASAVHQANAALQRATEEMCPLDLQGISFSWRMIHLGQGLYTPGDCTTPHIHKQLHLECILSGDFVFESESGSIALAPGQVLAVAPQMRHWWTCMKPGFMMGALIDVRGSAQKEFMEAIQERHDGMGITCQETCIKWQRELLALLTRPGATAWHVPAVSSLLRLLLIDLLEEIVDLGPWQIVPAAGETATESRARDLCRHAREFLEANYSQPIQLRDIALQIGISPRHLNRLYTRMHGKSIGTALQRLRLERSRRHLREHPGDMIKTVAYQNGFSSPAYFTACYRKAFGVLPAHDRYPN